MTNRKEGNILGECKIKRNVVGAAYSALLPFGSVCLCQLWQPLKLSMKLNPRTKPFNHCISVNQRFFFCQKKCRTTIHHMDLSKNIIPVFLMTQKIFCTVNEIEKYL